MRLDGSGTGSGQSSCDGARGGDRTRTLFPEPVFETGASACSATRARVRCSADYSRGRGYTAYMASRHPAEKKRTPTQAHLDNVAANLQLVADMGYGDVALAVPGADGRLVVIADARPNTAVAPIATSRVGRVLDAAEEPEAYSAFKTGEPVSGARRRVARGITYSTSAWPIGEGSARAVVLRDLAEQVADSAGAMEAAFMDVAEELLDALRGGPILDARGGEPFSAIRTAGDGVIRVGPLGTIAYASPNAVNIMRLAGVDTELTGMKASGLPGGGFGIAPVLGTAAASCRDRGRRAGARLPNDRPAGRRARSRRGPYRGAPPRAGDQGQGRDHPRGPPPGEEQPADDRLTAAHPGSAERLARGPPSARRGDRASRLRWRSSTICLRGPTRNASTSLRLQPPSWTSFTEDSSAKDTTSPSVSKARPARSMRDGHLARAGARRARPQRPRARRRRSGKRSGRRDDASGQGRAGTHGSRRRRGTSRRVRGVSARRISAWR